MLLHLQVQDVWFYAVLFLGTVVYYNQPYIRGAAMGSTASDRLVWYRKNLPLIKKLQYFLIISVIVCFVILLYNNYTALTKPPLPIYLYILTPFLLAFFYYGFSKKNLRSVGWLKPFVIGIVWASVVTIFPVAMSFLITTTSNILRIHTFNLWLFNFLYISVLCILFDIKDAPKDKELGVHTLPVLLTESALRQYIYAPSIVLLLLLSVVTVPLYFLILSMLVAVMYTNLSRKPLLYYLIVIDGLLLLKAFCGIVYAITVH